MWQRFSKRMTMASASLFIGLVAAACGQSVASVATPAPSNESKPRAAHTPTANPASTATPTRGPLSPSSEEIARRFQSSFFSYTWKTDFSKHTVPFDEVQFLGLRRDGIPPIYEPLFEPIEEANKRLFDLEPVIVVEVNGEAKAYPETVLVSHEVVNDVVGGVPIAATW